VDAAGNAYFTGATESSDFPIVNPLQLTLGGLGDVFLAKINPEGSDLIFRVEPLVALVYFNLFAK
jgi:hypothetical protein